MLVINNISKSFKQRGLVLDKLNLNIAESETLAIKGPSGSGKTTLLNLIGLLDRPDSGEIFFRNESILDFDDEKSSVYRSRNIGFVFQNHLLLPHLTLIENITLPAFAFPISKSEAQDAFRYAAQLMEILGIKEFEKKYPEQVSGGEAQRAALARAIINKPSLILGDEPTGALDSGNSRILGDLLLQVNREYGISVIIVTHSDALASMMHRRLALESGRLIEG